MPTKLTTEAAAAVLLSDGFTFVRQTTAYLDASVVTVARYQSRGQVTPPATGRMLREDARRRGDDVRDSKVTRYRDHGYVIVDVVL